MQSPAPATPGQQYPTNEVLTSFPLLVPAPELGGVPVAVLRAAPDTPAWLLIVATDPAAEFDAEWGPYGKRVPGADSAIDGLANTLAMHTAGCDAALKARALKVSGHNDWYIPSRAEALACFAAAREHLPADRWIWTSTQASAYGAWGQGFGGGGQCDGDKYCQGRVRAVRRLVLE